MMTVVTGGSGSGKSAFAEDLATKEQIEELYGSGVQEIERL